MDTDRHHTAGMTLSVFLGMLVRSFFIQGSFSFKYRQNTGFAFCMEPAGRRIWTDPADLAAFRKRHMEYYNGNPFMITLVLGAVVRLEEMLRNGEIEEPAILSFKKAVGAATGSLGDRFFWANLRPFSIVLGLLTSYYIGIWGILVALAVFNIPNVFLRWRWLRSGYRLGTGVVTEIQNRRVLQALTVMEHAVAVLIGFIAVTLVTTAGHDTGWTFAAGLALFFLSIALYRKNRGIGTVLGASIALTAAAGIILTIVF